MAIEAKELSPKRISISSQHKFRVFFYQKILYKQTKKIPILNKIETALMCHFILEKDLECTFFTQSLTHTTN